ITGILSGFAADFTSLIILRFFQGIGGSIMISLSFTMLGDVFKGERLNRAIALYFIMFNAGLAIIPLLSGLIGTTNWRTPLLSYFITIPISTIIWAKRKDIPNHASQREVDVPISPIASGPDNATKPFFNAALFVAVVTGFTAFLFLIGTVSNYYPIYLTSTFGTSSFENGIFLAESNIIASLLSSYVGQIGQRRPKAPLIALGFSLCSLSFFTLPLSAQMGAPYIFPILYGLGQTLTLQLENNLVLEKTAPKRRATANSVLQTAIDSGKTLGPIIFSLILTLYGELNTLFYISGIIAVTVAMIIFIAARYIT
ncbi:MAG: MFS transporter, partial [Candidatus Ranarchaeia archaeon]